MKVLVLDAMADDYCAHLVPAFPDLTFQPTNDPDEARAAAGDAEVIIALAHRATRDIIAAAPNLRWVQALTTGTDALTAPGVLPAHVLLTSTRGVHGPQMSELAFLHMLALNRRLMTMRDNQRRAHWERWSQPILEGRTIVIVGLGVLAEHLAERCKLFGMTTIGVSNGRADAPHFDAVHPRGELAEVAGQADFLLLLVPYAPDTHHLIDAKVLEAMKPTAFLINLARGSVLDEAALIAHLQAGRIAGAGLDIFSRQPLPPDNPLWRMDNVIITPNIGGQSDRFVEQTMTIVEPNLRAFIAGRLSDMINVIKH